MRGQIHSQRSYPGLVPGPGLVRVEIYRVNEPGVLARVDAYEGYDPDRPARSLFVRQLRALHRPRLAAWVYHLNRSIRPGVLLTRKDDEGFLRHPGPGPCGRPAKGGKRPLPTIPDRVVFSGLKS